MGLFKSVRKIGFGDHRRTIGHNESGLEGTAAIQSSFKLLSYLNYMAVRILKITPHICDHCF